MRCRGVGRLFFPWRVCFWQSSECAQSRDDSPSGFEPEQPDLYHPGARDTDRFFIVEQRGRIRILLNGTILDSAFLNVDPISSCCSERGLLGLAFHPDYANNGYFYVNYTDLIGNTVIARYSVTGDPNIADPNSALTIKSYTQPEPNHNGGCLQFGPDGMLYIARETVAEPMISTAPSATGRI